jgi:hypothetical protein
MQRYLNSGQTPWSLDTIQKEYRDLLLKELGKSIKLAERDSCLCGSSSTEILAKIDRFGLPFNSYICRECGLIFTSPYIHEDSLVKYYSEYYHPLTFGSVKPVDSLFERGQGRKIFRLLYPYITKEKISVFELGAGTGSNLIEFSREAEAQGVKTVLFGLEYNEKYVESGKRRGISLSCLPLAQYAQNAREKFNVIILSHVLEHFTDIESNIGFIRKISKKDALVYVEVPGVLDLKYRYVYDCDFLKYLTHAHVFNFSQSTLKSTLARFGLKMMHGNEKIEAVFVFEDVEQQSTLDVCESYVEIMRYLKDLEEKLSYYQSKNPNKRLVNRLKTAIYGKLRGMRK